MCIALLVTAALLRAPASAQNEWPPVDSGIVSMTRANSAVRPIGFAAAAAPSGVIVVPSAGAADIGRVHADIRAAVTRAAAAAKWDGAAAATLPLRGPGGYDRVLLAGTDAGPMDAAALADLGGTAAQATRDEAAPVAIVATGLAASVPTPAVHAALGAALGQYRYDRYLNVDRIKPPTQPITVVAADAAAAQAAHAREHAELVDGVAYACPDLRAVQ